MKLVGVLILSMFLNTLSFPQVMMGNYPIQSGNIWVYRDYLDPIGGSPFIMSIIDSTVSIDSLTYNIIEYQTSMDTTYRMIRFDTYSNYAVTRLDNGYPAPNHEYKYFKLNANLGDNWIVPDPAVVQENLFIEIFDSVTALMFGQVTYVEQYYIHDSIYIYNYGEFWNPEFGLTSNANDQGEPVEILTGCVINGIVYGDTSTVVGIKESIETKRDLCLEQNFPNPFNPLTTIDYQLPQAGFVTLKVYDMLGNEVASLVNEQKNSGSYSVDFDASKMASGVYIYQLRMNGSSLSEKMLLLK